MKHVHAKGSLILSAPGGKAQGRGVTFLWELATFLVLAERVEVHQVGPLTSHAVPPARNGAQRGAQDRRRSIRVTDDTGWGRATRRQDRALAA